MKKLGEVKDLNNSTLKKGLVIGIVVLFTGITIISSIDAYICKLSINEGREYWALLVAVNIYADHPEKNFPFPFQEVNNLYDTLLASSLWSKDHIRILRGEEATSANIINGFRWLDKMDDDDDISLIYINTHGGSLNKDKKPIDEVDGRDEMIADYWSFAYPSIYLWDDRINYYLSRLDSEGICLIFDTCHAGGFDDSIYWDNILCKNRKLSKEESISPATWINDFAEDISGKGRVILMACREEEFAYMDGFSPYIVDGLRGFADSNSDDIVSAEELFFYTTCRKFWQHPIMFDNYLGELPLVDISEKNGYKEKKLDDSYHIKKRYESDFDEKQKNPTSEKNSIVCGFICNMSTGEPIEQVRIYLDGIDNQGNFYEDSTKTNSVGFYEMNVAAGEVSFYYSTYEYLKEYTEYYKIDDFETLWINVSLQPLPPDNAFVCGYTTDIETHKPIKTTYVDIEWRNEKGNFFSNYTKSDNQGFYIIDIPNGEFYIDCFKPDYCWERSYRMDVEENETLWANISLLKERINVYISKPLEAIYLVNKRIFPFSKTIILGNIEVEAFVHDLWYEPIDAEKVEFYIDGDLKSTDTEAPYKWMWKSIQLFKRKHTIKVIAYDEFGYQVSDEIDI